MGTDSRVKRAYHHLEREREIRNHSKAWSFLAYRIVSITSSHPLEPIVSKSRDDLLLYASISCQTTSDALLLCGLHLVESTLPIRCSFDTISTSFRLLCIASSLSVVLGTHVYLFVISSPDYALTGQHQSPSSSPIESTSVQHGWSVCSSFSFSNWDESDDQGGERASADWSHASRASSRYRHLSSNDLQYFIAVEASCPEHTRTLSPSK